MIEFARTLPQNPINNSLISQVVRSGTSIGANYMEADAAEPKKDFRHKIGICRKESKETKHWLRMIAKADPTKTDEFRTLWKESQDEGGDRTVERVRSGSGGLYVRRESVDVRRMNCA